MPRLLTDDEIDRQLGALHADWRRVGTTLLRTAELPAFPTAIAVVDDVALQAEAMDHHPDIDIRWRRLTFSLSTHSAGGLTQLDIELAHRIDEALDDAAG
jgi:4a-hydroxytetrahydrobiopterin dehydratase